MKALLISPRVRIPLAAGTMKAHRGLLLPKQLKWLNFILFHF